VPPGVPERPGQPVDPGRPVDVRVLVLGSGLEQQHARGEILAEARRQDAAGRTGADDDVVVARHAQIRASVSGSNSTALPMSTTKLAELSGVTVESPGKRAVAATPPRRISASVSGPVGSVTSTGHSFRWWWAARGSAPPGSVMLSGRRPRITGRRR